MLETYRTSSIEGWNPSPVVALATSVDDSQVAAAREDGSLEIWLVSPGSVGWHCQLTIHGNSESRVSSLVWCPVGPDIMPCGRLLSSSIDGSVSEWDLFHLKQKTVLDSVGVSIWQMAVEPYSHHLSNMVPKSETEVNGYVTLTNNEDEKNETSESEDEINSPKSKKSDIGCPQVAMACDDGCVRIYGIADQDELMYVKSLPRVSGRALSVTWSADSNFIYSGSSDGLIRCWDVRLSHEIYRITAGHGGIGNGPELCIWSLLYLRSGTLVSADSKGGVQFWDCQLGTLLQAHSLHKGDVNALAAAPSHNGVFSAGSDGQVILYKLSRESLPSRNDESLKVMKEWVYVGYVRVHTHDVRALAVAVTISREDPLPDEKNKRKSRKNRHKEKFKYFTYHKWAHIGIPMLISAGDDTKLFAYSVTEFTKFSPHDICPAPQRLPIQLVVNTSFDHRSLLLVQASHWLDILCVKPSTGVFTDASQKNAGGLVTVNCLARVESKASRKIICSAMSNSGVFVAYSHQVQPCLLELKRSEVGKSKWTFNKRRLPGKLPFAHSMIFSSDSSRLIMAGHERRIYVVDVERLELVHTFTPCRDLTDVGLPPNEPPITKMFTSSDGQWLAAVNCFGDIYVFNLEILRQHWFISRLDDASVTAGGFPPKHNNILVITTSSNKVYVFDVEARQLGEWSARYTVSLPRRYQEFPGEVFGLSFAPSSSSSVVVYGARARCSIDFGMPVECDDVYMVDLDFMARSIKNLVNGRHKRKLRDAEKESKPGDKNFKISDFRHPVLFLGHLSRNSLLVIDKPWLEVVRNLEAPPVHRHIFGT